MIIGVSLFVAICVVAVCGYVAAGWKLEDSVYMVIITIFGVGYGEVQPVQSSGLRVNVWTINNRERAKYYRTIGVDGLITDRVEDFS